MRRLALVVSLWGAAAHAEEPTVPLSLQAELTSKITRFDRNFAARAGSEAHVLIAIKAGASDSERVAKQLLAALGAQPLLGGIAHVEEVFAYTTPAALVAHARETKAALIILAPGVASDGAAIAKAFEGYDGLTASTSSEGVEQGVVLGFDLVLGKPKMLIHLDQARKQNADFKAEVLKLMKVYP